MASKFNTLSSNPSTVGERGTKKQQTNNKKNKKYTD
jgi:hypothetical protein